MDEQIKKQKWQEMDKWEKMNKWDKIDEWEKKDKWGKWINGRKLISMNRFWPNITSVRELIYFWTMSENRFNQGDRKKIRQTEKHWEMRESG